MRIPKIRTSWIEPPPGTSGFLWSQTTKRPSAHGAATIARVSTPAGSVPNARPPSPARREAQNASATAGGAWRTSSEPCSASAMRSTTRRARASIASGSANSPRSVVDEGVEARVGAARASSTSSKKASSASGDCDQRAQDVERVDVARALPDRVQRRLAVEARHAGLLDVAVAAEALQRLARRGSGALADPVLADRRGEALERRPRRRSLVVGAREPHRQRGRRLGLDRQVGEHVLHQRLVDQQLAERAAVRGVLGRPARPPTRIPAAEPITQSSRVWLTISMIVGTPRPGSPTQLRPGAVRTRPR